MTKLEAAQELHRLLCEIDGADPAVLALALAVGRDSPVIPARARNAVDNLKDRPGWTARRGYRAGELLAELEKYGPLWG